MFPRQNQLLPAKNHFLNPLLLFLNSNTIKKGSEKGNTIRKGPSEKKTIRVIRITKKKPANAIKLILSFPMTQNYDIQL